MTATNGALQSHGPRASAPLRRSDCAAAARRLFVGGPWVRRAMQLGRPYICPFERIVMLVPEDATVLDAGCGDGLLLGLLATFGRLRSGIGFDASRAAIGTANAMRVRLARPDSLVFECRDAGAPWPTGSFEAVTLVDLLHHVAPDKQRHVLDEAARHVAPGGALIYKDMAHAPRWRALVSEVHDLLVARQRIHLVAFGRVRSALEEDGLALEHYESVSTGPYAHELAVFRRPSPPLSSAANDRAHDH